MLRHISFFALAMVVGEPPSSACPDGFTPNPSRAHDLVARFENPGRTMPRAATMCFGAIDVSVVSTEDRVLLLDEHADDRALVARLGHLGSHLEHAEAFDPKKRSIDVNCTQWVDAALRHEAEAFAIELRIARELGAPTPYAFDRDANENTIADYLRAHPDGAPGIEPLARGYRERCEKH